jgi:hypothetical protein
VVLAKAYKGPVSTLANLDPKSVGGTRIAAMLIVESR